MKETSLSRLLTPPKQSFFLFGPRGVGKSFWLKEHFGGAVAFDLLNTKLYLELSRQPHLLESKIGDLPPASWVLIDEIQKIPLLLDEVHRLMEEKKYRFALSGSSARKLKRGGANLLAGRAITKMMEPFSYQEMQESFDLKGALEWGTLPLVVNNLQNAPDILSAYVHTYIQEEIRAEGFIRKTEPFIRFLEIAGIMNGQQLNKKNIAREAMVPRATVETYFSILEETLIGHFLKAYRPQAKVREQTHPKFYWFDPGVARAAANRLYEPVDSLWLGQALETTIFHELRIYNSLYSKNKPLYFYGTPNRSEIDFVIETKKRTTSSKPHLVCIEVKYGTKWRREWEKASRSLKESQSVVVEKMFGIYGGEEILTFDEVVVLPARQFLKKLYKGEIF